MSRVLTLEPRTIARRPESAPLQHAGPGLPV